MEKRKTAWFHPAHGEKKNGLVSSSPWRKEKRAGFIQPMEKRKTIKTKKHGLVSRKEERRAEEFTGKCVYLSQSMV
jgi:hypothetical protein